MRDYVVFTDSSADFDAKMVEELGIDVQPLTFHLDDKDYANWPDGREMSNKDFYDKLREGSTSTTSQVNTTEFVDAFRPVLESGKDVLYLGFSSGLSGTVNSGAMAAKELEQEFKEQRVFVVDTLAASLGQGLLVYNAVQKKREGMGVAELAQWVEESKLNMAHWVTVDDLNFLKRGGRISGAAAMFGTMLSIKPIIHVDNEGHLTVVEKARGRKQSLITVVDHMEKTAILPADQTVFISHGDCLADAEFVADEVRRRFGTKTIYINYVGPVIGSHTGPGVVALFFNAIER